MAQIETPHSTALDNDAALTEARRWIGTPHANRMAVVGIGIDCIHYVREIMVAGGVCDRFTVPHYSDRLGQGLESNFMERLLMACFFVELVPKDEEPQDGDIIIFKVGRQSNHCGMFFAGEVWHAVARSWVKNDPLEHWRDKVQSFLRITALGCRRRPETITPEEMA